MGPYGCGQTWFQYAVIASPAVTVAVSWRAPDVPSSLQWIVGSVASVIGLLHRASSQHLGPSTTDRAGGDETGRDERRTR